ncbi:MAG: glycosyltransferase, partial [Bdellovibrionales bacterium]|nr:glycosyltransferase [Bdellovibrionales bacterium]
IAGPGDSAPNSDVRKQCREELGFRESDFVILSLGGLVWRKGPLELLLCRRHLKNPMKILIAGSAMFDGRRPCQLRLFHRCVAHLELFLVQVGVLDRLRYLYSLRTHCELESIPKGQIKLLPLTSDIQPLIAASDVVVSLHNFPHSSRSVFEAWRQRRPVVVFAKSGASDGVRHCENGIIVERKDPRCVAAALDSLFEACTLRERIANNGQLIAEKHHGEGAVIARLLKAYEKLTLSA